MGTELTELPAFGITQPLTAYFMQVQVEPSTEAGVRPHRLCHCQRGQPAQEKSTTTFLGEYKQQARIFWDLLKAYVTGSCI